MSDTPTEEERQRDAEPFGDAEPDDAVDASDEEEEESSPGDT
jgi:hypothetical protein